MGALARREVAVVCLDVATAGCDCGAGCADE